jgi:hypothetical protein
MEAFEASRQPRQWEGWDQEGNRIERLPESNQRPPSALLNTAIKATIELARLDGIWGSGDAWAGRNREKLEEFQRQRDAQWQAESAEHEAILANLRAAGAQQRSPAATPAGPANPPAATYERLWKLPATAAPGTEVAAAAGDASDAATDVCGDGPKPNLEPELVAERLKTAYAPRAEPAQGPAAHEPHRLPPADRELAFRRERLRKEFFAPLSRLTPQSPPALERVNGHGESGAPFG